MSTVTTEVQTREIRTRLETVPAVARFLKVSRSKVYQLMNEGLLPHVKLGKTRRIPWDAVERMVRENTVCGRHGGHEKATDAMTAGATGRES